MIYFKEKSSFQINKLIGTTTLWGGKRLGQPIHSPPPPIKCFDLSFYLSVFWIILLFHSILTLMNYLFQWEDRVFKLTSLLVIVGWGRLGQPIILPPPQKKKKSFDLSIDRLVFWFMLLFPCILTFMNDIFQRKNHF